VAFLLPRREHLHRAHVVRSSAASPGGVAQHARREPARLATGREKKSFSRRAVYFAWRRHSRY
jgi:hypothetical protein